MRGLEVKAMTKFIQVSTTINTSNGAKRIAQDLLAKRISSCVQVVGPIDSTYRWKGKVELAKEWLCLIKARSANYRKIETAIKRIHPYKIPEIIAVPILNGNQEYLTWIRRETTVIRGNPAQRTNTHTLHNRI
jgi:periplasmic divalent cation tolerance protein